MLPSIAAQVLGWSLRLNHFPNVVHFVGARATHAIDGVQNVATDAVQTERCAVLYFEPWSGIPFYPNNETEIPCERSFGGPTDHGRVRAIERMYDAQPHTSTNACTLSRCTICKQHEHSLVNRTGRKVDNVDDDEMNIPTEIQIGALASCPRRRPQPPPESISSS